MDLDKEAYELIEKIYKFKVEFAEDLSIVDTIIEYGYQNNISVQEIGNVISEHKEFMVMFTKQLEKEGYIKNNKEELEEFNEQEW